MSPRPLPAPSAAGSPLVGRRTLLRGMLAAGGVAALPGLAACGSDSGAGANAASLGSNYSDAVPKKALAKAVKTFEKQSGVSVSVNTVDHVTFQEQINSYLQGDPEDVFSWFAGYRMQFFADRGLAGDVSDVWKKIGGQYSDAFKQASTASDGKQYVVPFYTYPWAVFYRKSLFEEKGYEIPKTLDDFEALCQEMQKDGLTPLAFADKEGYPAMGTFDALNFRTNGYDFHMKLMRGEASWESEEVKEVFSTWNRLMPYHQEGSLGRDWLDAADGLVKKKAGMYYLGMFVGQAFTDPDDAADLDFFPFPEVNPEHGQDTIEAPIDGWMKSADPENEETAAKLLEYFGGVKAQETYLASDPNNIAANLDADTSGYSALQKKAADVIGSTPHITQFLDRDTRPDFASTVMIPSLQTFINKPDQIDSLCQSIERQKKSIFGA
jgi:multiple sugar transport system substrate-binding protein